MFDVTRRMASLLVGNARVIGVQESESALYLRSNKVIQFDELTMAKLDERETALFSYIHHSYEFNAFYKSSYFKFTH